MSRENAAAETGSAPEQELDVRVQSQLPEQLPAGSKSAIFILGSCFHRRAQVKRIEILVDDARFRPTAQRMPRLDLFSALHPGVNAGDDDPGPVTLEGDDDPNMLSYRSGFWATVPVRMPLSGVVRLGICARLADGTDIETSLAEIPASQPATRDGQAGADSAIAIAMATFNPDKDLFQRQIDSIRGQSLDNWICLISDDCTSPAAFERMRSIIGDDPRFLIRRSDRRLGFYRNFERAVAEVPPSVPFVALSDQDDYWYPDKLEVLLDRIGDAQLIYSDQRVVNADGRVLAGTYWTERANNHTNLASLLIANTVTGAASLFRRNLLDVALPFPDVPGTQYHDQWLGLVALATGKIAYIDRPLYDYVQHGDAALGHEAANPRFGFGGFRTVLTRVLRLELRRFVSGWRASYFFGCCRVRVLAASLLLRFEGELPRRNVRTLSRFARIDSSPAVAGWLALRRLRRWLGKTETLGGERVLVNGMLWRYIVQTLSVGRSLPSDGRIYPRVVNASVDASMPLPESQSGATVTAVEHGPARDMARIIRPIELSVSAAEPERVNLMIPTVELRHFFGGYIGKFNLARKLAEQGRRVRLLTVDPTPPLPRGWRTEVESYAGLRGFFEEVEIAFARDHDAPVQVSPQDVFIATTWWTAHVANAAVETLGKRRFLYLIQEYEPFTYPMGSWAAFAMSSYEFPHVALFSSELLQEFFAAHSYGVFKEGRGAGETLSASFQNAITAVRPPSEAEMAARDRRRVLFYARPEGHGSRNMFELGLLGLSGAITSGAFDADWEFIGIGAVEGRDRIQIAPSSYLDLRKRSDQESYASLLPLHDVGLSLMCTPHPSLVPIEMASAGMVTVTNSFETKTPEAMSAISSNLLTVAPSLGAVIAGLTKAVEMSGDFDRRIEGSKVNWSRSWTESLNAELMNEVSALLSKC